MAGDLLSCGAATSMIMITITLYNDRP